MRKREPAEWERMLESMAAARRELWLARQSFLAAAEGLEAEGALYRLRAAECSFAQVYAWARALPEQPGLCACLCHSIGDRAWRRKRGVY